MLTYEENLTGLEKQTAKSFIFKDLKWDSEFFGVSSAKAVLYKDLGPLEWDELKRRLNDYEFVSIENSNSSPINAKWIGMNTQAFLADVNIQFEKKIDYICLQGDIIFSKGMEYNDQILEITSFPFSKFLDDPELARRGGKEVYKNWLINSFEKSDKYFAIAKGSDGIITGYLLHSYSDSVCTIELICVLNGSQKNGVGTRLVRAVESTAYKQGCEKIKVGTQIRNINAINFYHKGGFKQIGCHQIYHLWNI